MRQEKEVLVAATEDLNLFEWGCYQVDVNGANGIVIGTGYQNTIHIVNQGCETENGGITAAQATLDAEMNGYSDWYLPSKDELFKMDSILADSSNIGQFAFVNPHYWSSSQYNSYKAFSMRFNNPPTMGGWAKSNLDRVRPIRAFGNWTMGCMDSLACNYNPDANMADGSCEYPEQGYDCDGNIMFKLGMKLLVD